MNESPVFAVYHADQTDGATAHPATSGHDYHEMVALAFRSARLFHPHCATVLLTDEHTRWEGLEPDVEIRRHAIVVDRFNLARFDAEIAFVRDAPPASLIVVMDSDVLVNDALGDLADGTWDIALTYRDHDEYPINKGVVIVNGDRRAHALKFLERARHCYEIEVAADSGWWGDQRALINAIGRAEFAARESDLMDVGGVGVRLLPCDTFNFSPDADGRTLGRALANKRVLHFKGPRKVWMRPYWKAYLASRESKTPASLAVAALWRGRLLARSFRG
ncbi:MAG: hypothetical protein QOF21_2822 [Actinomycetota bacterium]